MYFNVNKQSCVYASLKNAYQGHLVEKNIFPTYRPTGPIVESEKRSQ
jgi:hypothetical protein